jgi:hypothetical protein
VTSTIGLLPDNLVECPDVWVALIGPLDPDVRTAFSTAIATQIGLVPTPRAPAGFAFCLPGSAKQRSHWRVTSASGPIGA